ncbi:MAG: hypothetical protein Q7T18_00550 [Sedimentisphaerales bacterium]|nr:hypothetical protein [Sedimentisphaerales bacterium]
MLALFNARSVEYLVVGGYAMAFHGAPRFTGDIDLLVNADGANAKRVLAALNAFGFGSVGLSETDFVSPRSVIQLGVPPIRIDILMSLSGVEWAKAWNNKISGDYGGVPVFFISKSDLIANKKTLGRQKDLADIEALDQS